MPKVICAEVNEIFRNLCRSSCAEVHPCRSSVTRREHFITNKPNSNVYFGNVSKPYCILFFRISGFYWLNKINQLSATKCIFRFNCVLLFCFDCTISNCFDLFNSWSTAMYHTGPCWTTVFRSMLIPGFRDEIILIGFIHVASNLKTFVGNELFLIGRMSYSF